jgi:F-type H+-transporting ATPase subunit a
MTTRVEAINITPGEHTHWTIAGLTFNSDTIIGTLVAGGILILLGLLMRRQLSVTKPRGLQLFFETVVKQVQDQIEGSMRVSIAPFVVPLAVTLFLFILIANWLSLVPTGHHPEYVPPPASDVNLTYALALVVIVGMHVTGVRKKGFRGYYGHLFRKPRILIPLNLVEEVMKPITLALRLFGNIFAGTIMVALIAALPVYVLWAPNVLWKVFDAFIGLIQAFIFGLLTILYFASVSPDEEGAH